MKNTPAIHGVLPVLHMPFRDDDTIDCDVLAREVDHVFGAGVDGITLALASELLRLSHEERLYLTRELPKMAAGRGTVTISIGAETTRQAVSYAVGAEKCGADAVMAVPPFLVKASAQDKLAYFKAIHDAITIPMVVQDASGYMGGESMAPELQARMRRELGPRVYFKPEALPTGPMLSQMQELLKGEGVIFEGSGGSLLVDSYRRGVDGTMPGSDLIHGIVAIWRALERGDDDAVYHVYFPLCAIACLQMPNLDTYLAIEKYLLVKQGVFVNERVRIPRAYALDRETTAEIDRLYERYTAALDS